MEAQAQEQQSFKVELVASDDILTELKKGVQELDIAQSFGEITEKSVAHMAVIELHTINAMIKRIEEQRRKFTEPAREIIENAREMFNPALTALAEAKALIGSSLKSWQQAEQKLIDDARRKAEEEERRRRQETEQKAAAARAKAEEEAREKQRQAAEARKRQEEAQKNNDAKAAARAAAEAAKAQEEAAAKLENAERVAQQAQMQAAAAVVTTAPKQSAKISGFATKQKWVAVVEPGLEEDQVIRKIAAALPERPDLIGFLSVNLKAATKVAAGLKGAFNCPGLIAKDIGQASATRRKGG